MEIANEVQTQEGRLDQKQKTKERVASSRGFYISCHQTQIHPLLGKAKKLKASRFYQLKDWIWRNTFNSI